MFRSHLLSVLSRENYFFILIIGLILFPDFEHIKLLFEQRNFEKAGNTLHDNWNFTNIFILCAVD